MIRIRPERFPSGTVKKLQARSAGSFKVLKRIGSNAYVIELPSDYGISSTFNIEDLVAYKGPATIPDDPFTEPSPTPTISPDFDTIPPTSHPHIKNLLMLFWMNKLFSPGMEQFSVSWFDGMDDQSQIVHGLLERTYRSSTQTYWSTTRAALMPFHRRVIALPLHEFTGTRRNIQFLL
jgi:hypothetical protein